MIKTRRVHTQCLFALLTREDISGSLVVIRKRNGVRIQTQGQARVNFKMGVFGGNVLLFNRDVQCVCFKTIYILDGTRLLFCVFVVGLLICISIN